MGLAGLIQDTMSDAIRGPSIGYADPPNALDGMAARQTTNLYIRKYLHRN
jgi:hypothetical protein